MPGPTLNAGVSPLDEAHEHQLAGESEDALRLALAVFDAAEHDLGAVALFGLRGTPPDVDLDGDGLEAFEVHRRGPAGCQPVITACIDGDGTRIEGRGCAVDARFEDGYSAALPFTAEPARIVGIGGGGGPPPMP